MAGGVHDRGGMHGMVMHGMHPSNPWQILRDMVNAQAVCILQQCILA